MVSIKNVLLLAASASAMILPREVASTLQDIKYVDSNTTALTAATNAYTGGLSKALAVANAESALEKSITAANTNAGKHAAYTAAEANQVISYINGTLERDVLAAVNAVIAKKAQFTQDGLYNTVKNDLASLKNKTSTLGNTLLSKAPSSAQTSGKAVLAKVVADIQKGVAAFP